MDKKLNRQIGYLPKKENSCMEAAKKATESPSFKAAAKSKAPIRTPKISPETPKRELTTQIVVNWIKNHPMFAWTRMCDEIGLDKGNFSRVLAGKLQISPENLIKIKNILRRYGFE